MSSKIDIYTKQPILRDSKEHVLPNFLGGRVQRNGLIDKQTNDMFGSSIDAKFDQATVAIRNLIDARSDREPERPVPTIRNVVGADGRTYHIKAGGHVVLTPKLKTEEADGYLTVNGSVSERGEISQALRKQAKSRGLDLSALVERLWNTASTKLMFPPPMTFPFDLWDKSTYRAIAKIACNWLASHEHSLFMQTEFDPIREFVLNGAQPPTPPVQALDLDLRKEGLGPLDHFVSVEVFADGRVRGVVVLFGVLAFGVRLAEVSRRIQPFHHSYRVDQLSHHDRQDHLADSALDIEFFEIAAARSHEQFANLVKLQGERLFPTIQELQENHLIHRIIKPYWDKLIANMGDGQEPSQKAKLEFSSEVARAIADEMLPSIKAASQERHQQSTTEHKDT